MKKYPKRIKKAVRWCAFYDCNICGKEIKFQDKYYDGGIKKRVHVDCFENQRNKIK